MFETITELHSTDSIVKSKQSVFDLKPFNTSKVSPTLFQVAFINPFLPTVLQVEHSILAKIANNRAKMG